MEYDIEVSRSTIKRRAHENGIRGYAPIVKPLLDEEKAKKRLTFAVRMKKVLKEDPDLLHYMVFTDETKLRVYEQQVGGNVSVRCREGERYDPENVNGKVKYGGGGTTFWGCINFDRYGDSASLRRKHDRRDLLKGDTERRVEEVCRKDENGGRRGGNCERFGPQTLPKMWGIMQNGEEYEIQYSRRLSSIKPRPQSN